MEDRPRKRDPHRRQSILDTAARLVAARGYAGVTMAELGAEVGIAASAIYHHFPNKMQLLVELFDACLDRLVAEQELAISELGRTGSALREITHQQVRFVIEERAFAHVYYQEARNLPTPELARLRKRQRAYVETWAALLRDMRPDLATPTVEDRVHAAIGAIQSGLVHRSGAPEAYGGVLLDAALAVQLS